MISTVRITPRCMKTNRKKTMKDISKQERLNQSVEAIRKSMCCGDSHLDKHNMQTWLNAMKNARGNTNTKLHRVLVQLCFHASVGARGLRGKSASILSFASNCWISTSCLLSSLPVISSLRTSPIFSPFPFPIQSPQPPILLSSCAASIPLNSSISSNLPCPR
jgi:hypothetical protein